MKTQKFKASVLVVALIIVGIILVTALSVSLVSVKERNASMGASKTGIAFQNAQSGIESIMDALLKTPTPSTTKLSGLGNITCDESSGLTLLTSNANPNFSVEPKKQGEISMTCDDLVRDVASIKSTGSESGQERAVEAAVASMKLECTTIKSVAASGTVTQGCPIDYPNIVSGGCDSICLATQDNYIDIPTKKQTCSVATYLMGSGWCTGSTQNYVSAYATCCK